MNVLEIKNIHKNFNEKEVLRGIDLTIKENSIFGFVGKNGAGKTTTMKAILGLIKIDNGEIYVCGEKVLYGETPTNKYIGYLPDVPEFYSYLTTREYLMLCGESLGMDKDTIKTRSEELLDLVGLKEEKRRIKVFSRGMKQRLGVAQALLSSPKLLICDEPTSALDPIGRKEILDILTSARKLTTVLFSTHILSDVERICTDVALLDDGKIVLQDSVENLKKNKEDKFIVEVVEENDIGCLLTLNNCKKTTNLIVQFIGGDEKMQEVLDFILKNKINIKKIERLEPSLESLFMEMVK